MRRLPALVVAAAVAVAGGGTAAAQDDGGGGVDYFSDQTKSPLTYRLEGERTRGQKLVLLSLGGATAVAAGIGVYFHLESSEASDEVTRLGGDTSGRPIYTQAVDDRRQDALDARNLATGFYVVGGALLVTTVVAFIVTSPDDEIHEYNTSSDSRVSTAPYVAPIEGGLMVGKAWTY